MTREGGLRLGKRQCTDISNSILITGAPRSGTTIFGKILATFENIEYHFEPVTFYTLSSLYAAGKIDKKTAVDLVRVFLYEDLFLESIHGRHINLRPNDDSLILNSKDWKSINHRWQTISNRADAMKLIDRGEARLAVKMPNVMDGLPMIREAMPDCKVALIVRDGRQVVRSVVKKRWVSKESLENELYPYHDIDSLVNTPYWVEEKYLGKWEVWSEITRSVYMWRRHAEFVLPLMEDAKQDRNLKVFRYDDLVNDANATVASFGDFIGEKMTKYTTSRIAEIKKPDSVVNVSLNDFYSDVDEEQLSLFVEINSRLGYDDKEG